MGGVDIGTEWNLKPIITLSNFSILFVDIGTEWNLKDFPSVLVD